MAGQRDGNLDLQALTALRAASMSTCPLFYDHPGARVKIREGLEKCTERLTFVHRGRLDAFIGWWTDRMAWTGTPLQTVIIEYRPGDARALEWVTAALGKVARYLGPDTELQLNPGQAELVPVCARLGLHVEALVIVGQPQPAVRALVERYHPPRDLSSHGLRLTPIEPVHVDQVHELWRWVFNAEPEHCWFGTTEGYLAHFRSGLEAAAAGRVKGLALVALSGSEVVGYFETEVAYDPYWGLAAGMNLLLDERYRGRGITKTAYLLLLEAQLHNDVEVFKGGTSRRAILGMGKVLDRVLHGIVLGRRNRFPEGHWEGWLQ